MIPDNYRLLFSHSQIDAAVTQIGKGVSDWAATVRSNTGSDPLAIPILRGAIFFFSDLVREVKTSVEVAPMRVLGYDPTRNAQSEKLVIDNYNVSPKGRSILLVDDICDSGRTLHALTESILAAGAHEVKTAVLIRREKKENVFDPSWVGFRYPGHDWFVGYGMDDRERFRNLPDIYGMEPSQ